MATGLGALSLLGATGCVKVYQPLSGLHDAAVIDPRLPNLVGLRVAVHCPAGAHLTHGEAEKLCRRMDTLLTNQGADVATYTSDPRGRSDGLDAALAPPQQQVAAPVVTDLRLELRTREVETSQDPVSWALCFATFTLVPALTESTFIQDITIRDESGFLLLTDTLRGRIVRTFGAGAWAGNKVLNWLWRDDADEIGRGAAHRDLSADFYQQVSQTTFNAAMRWRVLQEAAGVAREPDAETQGAAPEAAMPEAGVP